MTAPAGGTDSADGSKQSTGTNQSTASNDSTPKTGDTLANVLYVLMILSAIGIVGTVVVCEKRRSTGRR